MPEELVEEVGVGPTGFWIFEKSVNVSVELEPVVRLPIALGLNNIANTQSQDIPRIEVICGGELRDIDGAESRAWREPIDTRDVAAQIIAGEERVVEIGLDDVSQLIEPPAV